MRTLLDAGHEVTVLDSLVRGNREALDQRARFVHGSVGDTDAVSQALESCDAVLHCAGLIEVAESQERAEQYWDANLVQALKLLEVMHGLDRPPALVFSSTAAVYGEPQSTPIPESAPLAPVNTYGATKLAFELAIESYEAAYGLRAIRLRYFNVAGAWSDGSLGEAHDPETHIIPRILSKLAHGTTDFEVYGDDYPTRDGTCVRDYIHVCDLAQAHQLALERLVAGGAGGAFNLGSGEGFTNLEVVRACARVTGRKIDVSVGPRRPGDPAVLVASSSLARDNLGWRPQHTDLDTMIGDAWRWHASHPAGYHSA